MDLLSTSSIQKMRNVLPIFFFIALILERYGTDGGRLGDRVVYTHPPSVIFGRVWVDLQQRLPFCGLLGWLDRLSFYGSFGLSGTVEFFVTPS